MLLSHFLQKIWGEAVSSKRCKLTPGAGRDHTFLVTTTQIPSHALLCLSTHFLCPISLCPGFTSPHSFSHTATHTSHLCALWRGWCCVTLPATSASYLWNLGLKAVACSLKHVIVVHRFCIFFSIPIDLKPAKSSKIKKHDVFTEVQVLMEGASLWATRETQNTTKIPISIQRLHSLLRIDDLS